MLPLHATVAAQGPCLAAQEDNEDDTADIEAELGIEVDRSDHGLRRIPVRGMA